MSAETALLLAAVGLSGVVLAARKLGDTVLANTAAIVVLGLAGAALGLLLLGGS
jgi:hypothetical protein